MRKAVVVVLVLCVTLACGSSRQVYRIDPETQTDLSGKWNDTDSRLVAEEMVSDCLSRVWLTNWVASAGEKPIVTVGTIRNRSSEHIDTETFTTDFERELINSGQVRFVASPHQREEIRDERLDQQEWASLETVKRIRNETGADFILVGGIKSITDEIEGTRVVFYQTDFEMINVESMEKVWIGSREIKKEISKKSTKW